MAKKTRNGPSGSQARRTNPASATSRGHRPIVVVAGDVCIDVLGLERPPAEVHHHGAIPNWQLAGQTLTQYRRGGAWLLAEMIENAEKRVDLRKPMVRKLPWGGVTSCGDLTDEDLPRLTPDDVVHSFLAVGEFQRSTAGPEQNGQRPELVYRIKSFHGFAGPKALSPQGLRFHFSDDAADADIVVCDDVGNGFRGRREDWPTALTKGGAEPLVIYKLGRPLPLRSAGGDEPPRNELWSQIRQRHWRRTLLILDANDLRLANVHISRRLSWERTAKEVVWQLIGNPLLADLRECRHLIVCFGNEGAIYYRNGLRDSKKQCNRPAEVTLFYDPRHAEDDLADVFPGGMVGFRSAFTAAFTATVARDAASFREDIEQDIGWKNSDRSAAAGERMARAVAAGMSAARKLSEVGQGPDFVSRLRGYINIRGVNLKSLADETYVIRRALLLRSVLKRRAPHLFDIRQQAQIDNGVLRAMLKVSRLRIARKLSISSRSYV